MKKFSLMALALGMFLAAGNAMAADGVLQDSTWLANDKVMSKQVGQPNSGQALGSVIVWTNAGMPADAVNWRECNGQDLTGTAVCKRIGICKAPNYQGVFLRGFGKNEKGKSSGALGVIQEEMTAPHRHVTGHKQSGIGYDGEGCCGYDIAWEHDQFIDWTYWDGWNRKIYSGPAEITEKDKENPKMENRPTNVAVRYLIKVD